MNDPLEAISISKIGWYLLWQCRCVLCKHQRNGGERKMKERGEERRGGDRVMCCFVCGWVRTPCCKAFQSSMNCIVCVCGVARVFSYLAIEFCLCHMEKYTSLHYYLLTEFGIRHLCVCVEWCSVKPFWLRHTHFNIFREWIGMVCFYVNMRWSSTVCAHQKLGKIHALYRGLERQRGQIWNKWQLANKQTKQKISPLKWNG